MALASEPPPVIQLSPRKFLAACAAVAAAILISGGLVTVSPLMLASEVMLTILLLFGLGSFRYQLDKNALTYGAVIVIAASFATSWWPGSALRIAVRNRGPSAIASFAAAHLGFRALDELVHLDTMLFILGLTFYVATISQSRILESISFAVLKKTRGRVVGTVGILTAIVAFSSGILDGVSMIGLMIRTLVIILFLAKADDAAVILSVIISTVVTTVCGMWLAYGEPPNLIMKANLYPHLTNGFFLAYCLPVAVGTYLIVMFNLQRMLKGRHVDIARLDVVDLHTADVRFLQASRHGEVFTPPEFIDRHRNELGARFEGVARRLHEGAPLGRALVAENVARDTRLRMMANFASDDLAEVLDRHYREDGEAREDVRSSTILRIEDALGRTRALRMKTQVAGVLSLGPFIGLLIAHGASRGIPLFLASFAAFGVAILGLRPVPNARRLALREAVHEYKEYLFLFPLFLSITLLEKSGFFAEMSAMVRFGIEHIGTSIVAFAQFAGACFLSALLDNNIVADFASRALRGLETGTLHLFSMAQIAGYAAGGCWTHIGSAQSVVAYAFIRREIDEHYTPVQWMKLMTPILLEIFLLMAVVVGILHFLPLGS